MAKKPYLVFSLALITACLILIGCNKKGTEPPEISRKRIIINAHVVDSNGIGIYDAIVTSVCHFYSTDILTYFNVETDKQGFRTFYLSVIDSVGADSVYIYASLNGVSNSSDTVRFIAGPENTEYNVNFVLNL